MTGEELKAIFVTGHVVTEEDMVKLIDFIGSKEGPKGDAGPQGEKGDTGAKGADGAKGDKGEPGTNGKDGFGTEAQYNDLVARIEALEGAEG